MNQTVNNAEEFVYQVCRQSFLSLWSYPNPSGKDKNKELCDILILCDPDVIIISVKEIELKKSGNFKTNIERWRKRAIEDSVKQIYGAERWINSATHVKRKDGSKGLPFPEKKLRRIHRVAVALGGNGKVPIQFGDFGKGFVHVFDEIAFNIFLNEIDTIDDFVNYLIEKESLYKSGVKTEFHGDEEDLLAFYLHKGRKFPRNYETIVVTDKLWEEFTNKKEYKAKKIADEDSYVWDRLITILSDDILHGNIEFGPSLNESELAVRIMARENRFGRRILGRSFKEFIDLSMKKKVRSRMALSPSDVIYVFLALRHGEDRQFRVSELGGRCYVARGIHRDRKTVIGLATEQYEKGKGFSFDILYMHLEQWTEEDQKKMEHGQKEFGYFSNPSYQKGHEDEYPTN